MTVSLLDIAARTTPADVLKLLLHWATVAGLPATAWQPGSVPRALLEGEAVAQSDALNLVAAIARGNVVDLSEGEWLTELARNVYALERKVAIVARGTVRVTNASGTTFSASAGSLLVASTQSSTSFRILDAIVSLADGASVDVVAQAEEAGLGGNVAVNTITRFLTPFPGVTINNPGDGATWLTQIGAREESDESLRTRCKARWPQLGGGPTLLAYEGWALSVPQVRQAKVFPNVPAIGKIKVVIAGDTNPLSPTVVALVQNAIVPRAGLCVLVDTAAASASNVNINATLYVDAAHVSTATADANDALRTLIASKQIGERLYRAEIIETLMGVPGVGNVALATPSVDLTPSPTAIHALLSAPVLTIAALPT